MSAWNQLILEAKTQKDKLPHNLPFEITLKKVKTSSFSQDKKSAQTY
jgi:hypothetical protein